jgi:hypothetical protein
MSSRDGFGGGFWLGTLVGGVVGGIVGASIASQRANRNDDEIESGRLSGDNGEKRPLKSSRSHTIDRQEISRLEIARRSLDDKISDLNNAIDAVRSSIGHPPGDPTDESIDRPEEDLNTQQPIEAQS